MARIPEEEIERLKREVSLERLAEARGVKLKRHGADLIGLCPFHDDRNPSLVISPNKNLWNCLGACRAGGTSIDWVMRAEGVSFRHAVELLREDHLPLAAHPGAKPPRISSVPKLPAPVSRNADDRALLLQIVSYYHETLKQTPEALKYLEGGWQRRNALWPFWVPHHSVLRVRGLTFPQSQFPRTPARCTSPFRPEPAELFSFLQKLESRFHPGGQRNVRPPRTWRVASPRQLGKRLGAARFDQIGCGVRVKQMLSGMAIGYQLSSFGVWPYLHNHLNQGIAPTLVGNCGSSGAAI